MELPFTRLEFLQVFAEYNQAVWPLQPVAAVLGIVALVLLFVEKAWADRTIAVILVLFWTIMGAGYHWLYFSSINNTAYMFGGMFITAALIFLVEGVARNRIRFERPRGRLGALAVVLFVYSLAVYPALGLMTTHPYPETPLFGVAPCPTTIFTLGLLVLAYHPRPGLLASVPVLWAAVGGSAAFLLDVKQDLGLIVAGLVWFAAWVRQK